eukprot:PhF_6_TR17165/c0_g1_i1/m.26427/K15171/SUPT4H1, SPT4; transcription elongation factor SPT4
MQVTESSLRNIFPHVAPSQLHACRGCRIILTSDLFRRQGCPNCQTKGMENTTSSFEGMVGVFNPKRSWVCSTIQCQKVQSPGLYAIVVHADAEESENDEE